MPLKKVIVACFCFPFSSIGLADTEYELSFENRVHHEANIKVHFSDLKEGDLLVSMSSSSPGRYAYHGFAKNIYGIKARNKMGEALKITRKSLNSWVVSGHDGFVTFEYTLYANQADGTYSAIDESHAHLNMPATLVWADALWNKPATVKFFLSDDIDWDIATQLKKVGKYEYFAPSINYLMDSPAELAKLFVREKVIDGQNIRLALHKAQATMREVDDYFEKFIAIIKEQKAIFGELPKFYFGEYTLLACLMPNAHTDAMEHRNSSNISSRLPIGEQIGLQVLNDTAHEFFHVWNGERIRAASLKPFNFTKANVSGELWFSEGFTDYYADLTLTRLGILSSKDLSCGLCP